MDIRSLKYFIAVYQTGSISAAARACFVAQPSISAAIRQLEDHLGTQLFLRQARGVQPTDAAQQLLPYAEQLTNDMSALRQLFKAPKGKMPFRLGLIRSLGAERMGQLLSDLTRQVPEIELTLVEPDAQCDARIVTSAYTSESDRFLPIWQDDFFLAVPANHPIGLQQRIQPKDFTDLPFIHRTPCEALAKLKVVLQQLKIELDVRARIHTLEYAIALVNAGIGCALLPNIKTLREHSGMKLLAIDQVPLSRTIGLAYPKSSEENKAKPLAALTELIAATHHR